MLFLVVIVLVLWLVVALLRWAVTGDAEPPAEEQGAALAGASQLASPSPEPEPEPDPVTQVNVSTSAKKCDPQRVVVAPTVASGQTARDPVRVDLGVTTTQGSACTLALEASDVIAVIQHKSKPVWDAAVCRTALIDDPIVVSPGWITSVSIEWSGRYSGSACSDKDEYVEPGKYRLRIATLGGEPSETAFTLNPAEKEANADADDSGDSVKNKEKSDNKTKDDKTKDGKTKKDREDGKENEQDQG